MPWRCLVSFLLATQVDVFENCDQTVCYMLWTTPQLLVACMAYTLPPHHFYPSTKW